MATRGKDNQLRCPYCHRHLARTQQDYRRMKYCPECGNALPTPGAPGFNSMMKGAQHVARACPIEIITALVATGGALQAIIR